MSDHIIIEHVTTGKMPTFPDMPFRLLCSRCQNTIIAGDKPIPQWMVDKFKDVPCSECVDPEIYRVQLEKLKRKGEGEMEKNA